MEKEAVGKTEILPNKEDVIFFNAALLFFFLKNIIILFWKK